MTDQWSFFTTFKIIPPGTWKINGIGGVELQALGIGNIDVITEVDGVKLEGTFHNVLYVPGLGINLFSIGAATDCNVNVEFTDTQV